MTDKLSVCSEHFLGRDHKRDLRSGLLGIPDALCAVLIKTIVTKAHSD